MGYQILHKHGQAGPKGRASYFKVSRKVFKTKTKAKSYAKQYENLDGARYVLTSKVKPSPLKKAARMGLYYIKK